jgi:hypothetical protein
MIRPLSLLIAGILALFGLSTHAVAFGHTPGPIAVDLATGLNSNFGIFGGGVRLFPTENWDLHLTAGVDAFGPVAGVGTALYADTGRVTCFFLFSCKQKVMFGASALQNERDSVSVTADGVTGKYRVSSGYAASVVVGTYDTLAAGFTYGVQAGYRAWWQRPATSFESGTASAKGLEDVRKLTKDSLEVALTLGWRF